MINPHYAKLQDSYLFSTISHKVASFQKLNPKAQLLHLGIGDVTLPLSYDVLDAMHQAIEELRYSESFHGYGEEQGYLFLREAICDYYQKKAVSLTPQEVFISDGAKSDIGNLLDLFDTDATVLLPNPGYPVYEDTNIMAGRHILYAEATIEQQFLPMPDFSIHVDIIYLCSPSNPTGAIYTAEQLQEWVNYAIYHHAILLFDAAYEAFVTDSHYPTSIYQIPNAKECAIEICSLSKTAGFTGIRCGYTIVPSSLMREETSLHHMWLRRQTTKFNGVSYITQRGAQAVFTQTAQVQIKKTISYYMQNAHEITQTLDALHLTYTGGIHSPYIWLACPPQVSSWQMFDALLHACHIVTTPGLGFGSNGEGYVRLSAFANQQDVIEAMKRLQVAFQNGSLIQALTEKK